MIIRIVLVGMPRLLGDIVESAVMAEPDMAIVGRAAGRAEALATVLAAGPDVVILAESETGGEDLLGELLNEDAGLKVVTVAGDGRRARLYEMREVEVREVSPQGLIQAIREAMSAPGLANGRR